MIIVKKKIKSKNIFIGIVLVITLFVGVLAYTFRFFIKAAYNKVFPPENMESIDLTTEEKLEDFYFLYDTFTTSMPSIDKFEEVYGFSFIDRKELYEDLIRDTDTDLEFYAAMEAITQEISSFHTDLVYPTYYDRQNCYHNKEVKTDRKVISAANYWDQQIVNAANDNDCKFLSFVYEDGSYTYDELESTEKLNSLNGILLSIDGVSADEYITQHISTFSIHYDGAEKKAYRRRIVLNDKHGTPCNIIYQTTSGEKKSLNRFVDILYEEVFWEELYEKLGGDTSYEPVIFCADEQVSYIKIDDMELSEAKAVKSVMNNIQTDSVILDLRENYGGLNWFAGSYIYPYLYSESFKEEHIFYISDSKQNQCITDNIFLRLFFDIRKTDQNPLNENVSMYKAKKVNQYDGKASHEKNVVILTSENTGSAADNFVYDMKKAAKRDT